jgi:phosphoribosylglycinamide formyltransferase-1
MKLVVLVSGRGSNLAALIEARAAGRLAVDFAAVVSDRADAPALEHARRAGIPVAAFALREYPDRLAFDRALFAAVDALQPALIVLAGYMRIISDEIVDAHTGRMINIHPSLLPAYQGLRTHERVLRAGDRVHGASVHFVGRELDGGPVIAQVRIAVEPGDDAQALAARLLPLEHLLLERTVELAARRRIEPTLFGVALDGRLLAEPLQLDVQNQVLRTTDGDVV